MASEVGLRQSTFENRNPATGELISIHGIAPPDEVRDVVQRARAAQPSWAGLPIRRRVEVLRRFGHLLAERKNEVARAITAEAGKPHVEALLTEIVVALDAAQFCADNVQRILREEDVPHANPVFKTKRSRLVWEPLGVVAIISPWNYPFSIPATGTLAALVCGNAVVLKPSEFTPESSLWLQKLLHEAGVPKDLFGVVLGEGSTGAALLESDIDKIIFTGSVATGKRIAKAAAERLIPCVLELGGKDAMIVCDDADLDSASSAAVWGALMNAGQTCLSVERCLVDHKIHDRFVYLCSEKIEGLRIGDGARQGVDIGPMVSRRQLEIVQSQVEDARASGAHILSGGRAMDELGPQFYAPTLVTGVDRKARLWTEETFGPVLAIMPFRDDSEAVYIANDSEFGLAASVWTKSRKRGERLARQLHAGAVTINDLLAQFAMSEAPHGGVKASGIGRTHGLLGMREMVRPKYIDYDPLPKIKKLWWYGYGERFSAQMDAFTDMLFAPSLTKRISGAIRSTAALFRKRL